jgi:hypothetical protein
MKPLLLSIALLTFTTACLSAPVNRESILSAYSKIDISDGANEDEMKIIAQRYLLVTNDEPCKSDAQNVKIGNPHMKCGWVDPRQRDGGCYIGFSKKAIFEIVPLYVKVSDVTGNASCAGYLILK